MRNRLFIIGNGFDLAHELPTSYPDHFKRIAESNEKWVFRKIYGIIKTILVANDGRLAGWAVTDPQRFCLKGD